MSPPAEVALRRFNCCADPSSQRCTYRFQSQELFQQIERRSPHTQPIRVQVRFTRRCFITLVVRLLGCHNATKCQRFYSLDGAACSTLYRERCWSTCCCCCCCCVAPGLWQLAINCCRPRVDSLSRGRQRVALVLPRACLCPRLLLVLLCVDEPTGSCHLSYPFPRSFTAKDVRDNHIDTTTTTIAEGASTSETPIAASDLDGPKTACWTTVDLPKSNKKNNNNVSSKTQEKSACVLPLVNGPLLRAGDTALSLRRGR